MDTTITDFTAALPQSEDALSPGLAVIPVATTRETPKEFVRRPAKGWTGSTPVPVLRFDHHCPIWEP